MSRVVTSVATGPRFCGGMRRLCTALTKYQEDCIMWYDQFPPGPPHEQVPFGFKLSAIDAALDRGFDTILWLDSSIVPIRLLSSLWSLIEIRGYWFSQNYYYTVGEFCCDSALKPLGITREQAFEIPLVIGGAFGLDFTHKIAQNFYKEWKRMMQAGAFNGPYSGGSTDPRVRGHRHDQTAASVAAWRVGMKLSQPPDWIVEDFDEPTENTVLTIQR